MQLTNWREYHNPRFETSGIQFDVLFEDGLSVEKQFTTASKKLIRELQFIIQMAETNEKDSIWVSIFRTGDGVETDYKVTEIPPLSKVRIQKIGEETEEIL